MDSTPTKRGASLHDDHGSQKRARLSGDAAAPASAKGSFGARMMAKMGYQKGQGLGREGTGIINPIEVKLRPQGAGVGVVKEKTAQAKAEAKRQAEQKGEQYEESSEEEKEKKARRKTKSLRTPTSSGRQTPLGRPKQKVRTVAELEAEEGLVVPNVFKSLIDHTGQQPKLLTSTAGLMLAPSTAPETEMNKIATYARRELDAFAGSWHALQERKEYAAIEAQRLQLEIEKQEAEAMNMRSVADAMDAISMLGNRSATSVKLPAEPDEQFEALTAKLEQIQLKFADELQRFDMAELAVAAVQPLFKEIVNSWAPFKEPLRMVPYLHRLRAILGVDRSGEDIEQVDEEYAALKPRRLTSPYESLIFTQWLPKIRTLIVNDWDPTNPTPMLLLVSSWKDILPGQVYDIVINQLIVQRLSNAVKAWRPHAVSSGKKHTSEPHTWLFPWLEHLDEYHLDPRSSNGLLSEVKRKFRTAFSAWDSAKGVIVGLEEWQGVRVFRGELNHALDMNSLPALARYLHDRFEVDPSDQDLTPIEKVLQWAPLFSAEKFSRVFVDAFFPKWLNVLHLWLVSDPNYEEIGQWYTWWQSQIPKAMNNVSAISAEWEKGLTMMNRAMDLGSDRVKTELAPPKAGPRRPVFDDVPQAIKQSVKQETKPVTGDQGGSEITFKDLLEELCEKEGLLMLPLRKAHPQNGLPLWRITASATGGGGVLFYIKGDVMWAQNKKDRAVWEPADVFQEGALAALAEGR